MKLYDNDNYYCINIFIADDLEDSQLLAKKTGEENSALKTELEKAQDTITEKSGMVIDLQGKHFTIVIQLEKSVST